MSRRTLELVVAAVAAYKAVEHLVIFGWMAWLLVGAPFLLGAAWTLIRPRAGTALIAVAAVVVNLTPAYRNHVVLLAWVALALALFGDEQRERFALRCQLSIMYGFAALAKIWPDWLSGAALEARTWVGPLMADELLVAVAWGTIVVEFALAAGVWSRWRGWIWIAAATHGSFVAFTQVEPWDLGRLTVFGVLALATWHRVHSASSTRRPVGSQVPDDEVQQLP